MRLAQHSALRRLSDQESWQAIAPAVTMALLRGETAGLAVDFLAAANVVRLRDGGDSLLEPDALFANLTTSPKLVRTEAGGLAWTAHNLFLHSDAPATQDVTLVSGAVYTMRVSGPGSLAGSSGASGTATEGDDVTFTATGTTGTFTKTGTLATIQLNRGPVATAYLATTGSRRIGVPITYDARLGETSLWAEPQATNLCARFQELGSWVQGGASGTTADQLDDPIGDHTADLVTGSGAGGVRYTPTLAAGPYALSIFAAAGSEGTAATMVTATSPAANRRVAQVDLATHALTLNAGVGSDFTDVEGAVEPFAGFDRLEQRITLPSGVGDVGYWLSGQISSNSAVLPNGKTLYGWGAQVEAGACATSPIPTYGGTQQTRDADAVQVALSGIASYDPAGNTLLVAARTPRKATQKRVLACLDDGTADARIRIERNASLEVHCIVSDGGVDQADLNLGTVPHDTDFTVAFGWAANDVAACLDGGAIVADTAATLPTLTTLRLGHSPSGEEWNGLLKQLALVPGRKPDAWMQAKTAGVLFGLGEPEFWDNFEREDGALGVSPSGHAWLQVAANTPSGNWTEAAIVSGALFAEESGNTLTASYNAVALRAPVKRAEAVIRFDGTADVPGAGIISTRSFDPDSNGYITGSGTEDGAVHMSFTDNAVIIGFFDPGVGFSDIIHVSYPTACVMDGETQYKIGWEIDGETITLFYPGGSYEYTDERVSRLNGRYITFESWRNAPGSAVYFDAVAAA